MNDVEIRLKELIIERYGSLAKFCEKIEMPWTTLDSILKRGVDKANITNILKITSELSINTKALAEGKIIESSDTRCDFYDDAVCDIVDQLLKEDYVVIPQNLSNAPFVIIESPDHRILIAMYEDDLVSLYEKVLSNYKRLTADIIIENIQRNLSPDEAELLLNYQKLNDLGKDRAREDVADLTEIPKYIADYPDTLAAHFDGEEMTDQQKAAVTKLRDIVKQQEK